jgi:hypothetical protein
MPFPTTETINAEKNAKLQIIEAWVTKNIPGSESRTEDIDKTKVQYVSNIAEMAKTHHEFIANVQKTRNILSLLAEQGKLDKDEKQFVKGHIADIDKFLAASEQFADFANYIKENANITPEELAEQYVQVHEKEAYKHFIDAIGPLNARHNYISKLVTKHQNDPVFISKEYNAIDPQRQGVSSFTIMPPQRAPRIGLLISDLRKYTKKYMDEVKDPILKEQLRNGIARADAGLEKIRPINDTLNQEQSINAAKISAQYDMIGVEDGHKAAVALKNLNALTLDDKMNLVDLQVYAKAILPQAYPQIFKTNQQGGLSVLNENKNQVERISKALMLKEPELDPKNFDAKELDKLYAKDKNPLWLVLKTKKPVDEQQFTAKQKINALKELAQAFKNNKIDKIDNHLHAYELAKQALEVVKQHPKANAQFTKAFGPKSSLGKWILAETSDNLLRTLMEKTLETKVVVQNKAPLAAPAQIPSSRWSRFAQKFRQEAQKPVAVVEKPLTANKKPTSSKEPTSTIQISRRQPSVHSAKREIFVNKVISHYDRNAKDAEGLYKDGFKKPEVVGNATRLNFPTKNDSLNFLKEFAALHQEGNFTVRNDNGQIIAHVQSGQLKVFDARENNFTNVNENSELPKQGVSEEQFKQLIAKPPEPVVAPNEHPGEEEEVSELDSENSILNNRFS